MRVRCAHPGSEKIRHDDQGVKQKKKLNGETLYFPPPSLVLKQHVIQPLFLQHIRPVPSHLFLGRGLALALGSSFFGPAGRVRFGGEVGVVRGK
jgi:hypothetical protein